MFIVTGGKIVIFWLLIYSLVRVGHPGCCWVVVYCLSSFLC